MADETKASARAGGWSDAEKFLFLVKVIAQIGGEKITIKFDQIDMPGRTSKAMTHVWAKIKGDAAAMDNGEVKPTPVTPRKRTAKAIDNGDDSDAENPTKKQKTPAPRKKAAPKTKATKATTKKAAPKVAKSAKNVESEDVEVVPELASEFNEINKAGTNKSSKVEAEGSCSDAMEGDDA